uniref:Fe2OG dioxygenase domain-containing protein n=1 Tax=Ciona savignyi TaxID=51511 RepID=H2YCC4_CIOSA
MKLKDEEYFQRCHSLMNTEGNLTTMRTLYYRPLPNSLPPGQVRLGEHSDYGSITLLFQDDIGGLEIENKEGEYVPATPLENTVIVNIGDILQFWTQGKLKSTRHRVMIPDDKDKRVIVRRSMVYFVRPDNDVIINDPLAYRDKEKTKEPNVTPITSHQYSMMKFNKTFNY